MHALPQADVTPLRGGPSLRWGVIGPGGIAGDWVDTVLRNTGQRVVAVGSRSLERAERFAAEHGVERAVGSPEALVADAEVDAVYVATPHSEHRRLGVLAADAGKHVLIEKPIGLTADDAIAVRDAARRAGVLAAEAMWTRYLPGFSVVAQLLQNGDIGDVRLATADIGWQVPRDAAPRLWDPAVGGGALLDMGVYAFWFTHFAIGAAHRIEAVGSFAAEGVDDQLAAVVSGADHRMAAVTVSMAAGNTGLGSIVGTAGWVRFLDPLVFPARFVVRRGSDEQVWEDRSGLAMRDGLAWQSTAIAQAVADGRTDSPVHPIESAIEVMRMLDTVRELITPVEHAEQGSEQGSAHRR
ncbi:MAG TPA: Gfo/Idh/MocA family oxidoreductase [Amnibacterium sp.]